MRVWEAKDSPRTTTGELQRKVEFWGQKTFQKWSNSTYNHHMLFGRVSRKNIQLIQKQTPGYSVIRHDWKLQWDWLQWSDETKELAFQQQTTQDGFGEHMDKKYPMCTMKSTAVFLMLWAYTSAGGPGHLVETHGIMDSLNTNR